LECNHTDAGDPWCVLYDRRCDIILLHIARIDRVCVVYWPLRQRSITTATIEAAIEFALCEILSPA
jgi:hypothetical protein